MMFKRIFAAAMSAAMVLAMSSCGGNENEQDTAVTAGQSERTVDNSETTGQTETTSETTEETTSETTEETTSELLIKPKFGDDSNDGVFTIDSDVYPLDSEEITIRVDMSMDIYGNFKYSCIDLENLKNYPNLKRLSISTYNDAAVTIPINLINFESTADLNCLEEITLGIVSCDGDWLTEINSLKKLKIEWCELNWEFLHDLSQVETLILYRCDITELNFINDMKSLSELSLTNIGIEKFEIEEENNSVKRLTLSENAFTDISGIAKLRSLEYLYVSETNDLENQIEKLEKSLPACEIKLYVER